MPCCGEGCRARPLLLPVQPCWCWPCCHDVNEAHTSTEFAKTHKDERSSERSGRYNKQPRAAASSCVAVLNASRDRKVSEGVYVQGSQVNSTPKPR